MKECNQPYYVMDGRVCDCSSFQMGLIDEGKSIYEVIRLSGNRLLFPVDHIERLFTSMKLEGLEPWPGREEIHRQLELLIRENPPHDGNLKIVMNFHSPANRHFLAYFVAHRYPSDEDYSKGVKVITFLFERPDPNKKLWRPAFRSEVAEAIRRNDAFEALLVDSRGYLPEASKANFFAILGNTLVTSPDEFILPGITRRYVLKTCREAGIPVVMKRIHTDELKDMDGLFLTGTSLHVLPVSRVNDLRIPLGNGTMEKIMKEFQSTLRNYLS
jgi:branched-chain amino acid aminotransferase